MKKILKNASLFIIAIVFTFGFGLNVNAVGACGNISDSLCRVGERGVIKAAGNGHVDKLTSSTTTQWDNNKLYYEDSEIKNNFGGVWYNSYWDDKSVLFCLDAQYEGYKTLYAERFLLASTDDVSVQVFDAGVMSILLAGAGQSTGDANDYFARLQAIRGLEYTFGNHKSANPEYLGAFYAGQTITSKWNKENAGTINALNAALAEIGAGSVGGVSAKEYYFDGTPVNKAEAYYVQALQAATEYAKKLATSPKVNVVASSAGEPKETGTEGNIFVEKDVVHTIKLSGFTKEHKFIIKSDNNGIQLDGNYTGLIAYISKIEISGGKTFEGKEAVTAVLGQNLVEVGEIPEKTDVEIKITAHFEGWKSSTDSSKEILKCGQQPIKYSIDGIYDSGVSDTYGDYIGTIWYSGASESQRFVGIEKRTEKNENGTPWTSPYETYLIDACSCENLKEACVATGNPNSNECKELEEANCGCDYLDAMCKLGNEAACTQYEEECKTSCNTDFSPLGKCCDASNNIVISTSDEEMKPYEIHGNKKEDIKACFVTKVDNGAQPVDEKNNSYKMMTDSSVASNQFCSVNCREDYKMQLPSAKRVNAGRYFTFKVSIEGTKQCFTNTIKRDKYKEIIKEQLEAIEDAANRYAKYYKAWEIAFENEHKPVKEECLPVANCTCGQARYTRSIPNGGRTNLYSYKEVKIIANIRPDRVDLEKVEYVNAVNSEEMTSDVHQEDCPGSTPEIDPNTGNPTGTCVYCAGQKDVVDKIVTITDFKNDLNKKWNDALTDYNTAIETLKQAVKDYNACSEWETKYEPKPDVTYDYDEKEYSTMAGMPVKMNGQMSDSPTNYAYCNVDWKYNQDKVSVDPTYESCIGGSGFGGKETDELIYVKCTLSGGESNCETDPYLMSNAIYRKSNNESKGNYVPQDLFYNIYPSGEISVNSGDDRVLLEEKLPVRLSRRLGIYQYYVNFTNVGEFYSNGTQGRFMGENGIIENSEYVCAYLVNIPEQEFTCDAMGCEGPDCVSDCIGPNCEELDCDGIDCIADCVGVGCIYDEDAKSSIYDRIVSLKNLFPNGTDSYNWDKDKNDKALATISEIEGKEDSIFDETPILSITIDQTAARKIRDYNDEATKDSGYVNKTIKCQSRGGYEQIVCYSSFIDDLLDGTYGNAVNKDNSLIADDGYRHGESSGYFTLWGNRISEDDMMGPSWK